MSLVSLITNRRVKEWSIAAIGIGAVLGVIYFAVPSSGAYFFDSKQGHTTITTPSQSLAVTNDDGSSSYDGGFDLAFAGLKPGATLTRSFNVTNTGTLTGHLRLVQSDMQITGGSGGYDMGRLIYEVNGIGAIPLPGASNQSMELGDLNGGETRSFTITVGLDGMAGNEWQNLTIRDNLSVVLSQV